LLYADFTYHEVSAIKMKAGIMYMR
jgi:hypothetical protein